MATALAVKRMHQAAKGIQGTAGEFRRVAVLNFCATALEFLGG